MNINWKVRLKNPVFWTTIIPAVVGVIYTVLGALGIVPALSESAVLNFFAMLVTVLTTLGVLVDPTTAGVNDSEQALEYEKPKTSEDER